MVCLLSFWTLMRKQPISKCLKHDIPGLTRFCSSALLYHYLEDWNYFLTSKIFLFTNTSLEIILIFFISTWLPLFLALQCIWSRLNNIPRNKYMGSILFFFFFLFKILSRKFTLLFLIVTLSFRDAGKIKLPSLLAFGLVLL